MEIFYAIEIIGDKVKASLVFAPFDETGERSGRKIWERDLNCSIEPSTLGTASLEGKKDNYTVQAL